MAFNDRTALPAHNKKWVLRIRNKVYIECLFSVFKTFLRSSELFGDFQHHTANSPFLLPDTTQVFETSVNVSNNSPSRDYSHPDNETTQKKDTSYSRERKNF